MVREGEVAWLHKADMPGSGHAEHAEESRQQGWHIHKQKPHSPDQGAAARKRKQPPVSRHSYPASRSVSAHAGGSPLPPPSLSLALAASYTAPKLSLALPAPFLFHIHFLSSCLHLFRHFLRMFQLVQLLFHTLCHQSVLSGCHLLQLSWHSVCVSLFEQHVSC